MSFKVAHFLAWQYVREATRQSTLRTMLWVCFGSIFVGTFSLALIVAIMQGFETATHAKLQGIYPDIIIESPTGTFLDAPELQKYLKEEYPAIAHTCTYSSQQILLQAQDTTVVGMLKGIAPQEEMQVTTLSSKYSLAKTDVIQKLHGNNVLVGKGILESLDLEVGDSMTLLYNADPHAKPTDMRFASQPTTIIGTLNTGIAEYDNSLVIAHHTSVKTLLEDDCINELGVKLAPHTNAQDVAAELKQLPGLVVYRWQDLYPALVSALKLEKYAMAFLLGLITLVASMNNISLLFMFITAKRKEIALLKTFGMTNNAICFLFLCFNMVIATCAATAGLMTAYGVGRFLQLYPFIELPDVYYVTHLPVSLDPLLFLAVFCAVLFLSILTALLPIFSLKKINITQTLRFE